MNSRNTQKEQQKDEIKRACTPEKIARWIANETGEKANRSGRSWRVGKGGAGGSIVISQDADGSVIFDHADADLKGDVFEVVKHYRGCDFAEALRIAADEIACMPIYDHTEAAADSQNDRRAPQTAAERKPVYERFMERYKDALVSGLNSPAFERMMSARGLDASKIATLPRIGFALDDTGWINSPKAEIKGFKAVKNSIVVWNETDFTIKALEIDEKTGKRSGVIRQLGSCHWIPFDKQPDGAVYICEGETSAIALMFAGISGQIPAFAIPLKPEGDGEELIRQYAAKSKRIYLAYDNDAKGRELTETAKKIAPHAIDMSALWSGNEWTESADPNDFVKRYGGESGEKLTEWIECQDKHTADTDTAPKIDARDAEQVRAYFLNKAEQNQTKAEKITMSDPVFGEFIKLVDPYRMRSYAPEFCIVVWGTAYLSNYRINAPSNPRIINLVARSSGGKDWTLGTHKDSRSLFWQLKEFGDIDVYKSADASITGNGMSKAAFLWAADPKNKVRILGKFRTEFGNAQTRGYGVVERAGSIGNYDIAICDGEISKPENKADQKELQGYNDSYPLSAFEVRAFQDINGAQVVSPRLRGTGEARRESWFYMKSPLEDPICTDENAPFIEAVLKESAFMPRECSRAFKLLKQNCLTINPFVDDYTQPIEIDVDTKSDEFINAYRYTLDTVHNQFYRANRCELLRDKLAFFAGLSAGMHLRATAIENDYWIAAYFCECLSNSLDLIFECAGTVDDPDSEIAKIMQRVTDAGARGVRRERLSGNKKLLDELCGKHTDRNGVAYYEEDAPLVVLRDTDKRGNPNHYFYFLKENVSEAKQRNPNLR